VASTVTSTTTAASTATSVLDIRGKIVFVSEWSKVYSLQKYLDEHEDVYNQVKYIIVLHSNTLSHTDIRNLACLSDATDFERFSSVFQSQLALRPIRDVLIKILPTCWEMFHLE
jgi:hypothetical protein